MRRKTVHILNGDSTASILKESGISGDMIVWREMLCEGPLSKTIGSDRFWTLRYAFFEAELAVKKLEYYDKIIKELVPIEDLSGYDEVVLWFEHDLFCQVNLMALCTYLLAYYRKDLSYYLVCVGTEKNKENLQTLADYSSKEYQKLYEEKTKLSRHDLLFAQDCWEKYVANDLQELKAFNFDKKNKFKYFQLAIDQHLKRCKVGSKLSQIDYKLLKTIANNSHTQRDIIRDVLIWQKKETVYGFGDLQYSMYLEKLHPFYDLNNEQYFLNDSGKTLLKQHENN